MRIICSHFHDLQMSWHCNELYARFILLINDIVAVAFFVIDFFAQFLLLSDDIF